MPKFDQNFKIILLENEVLPFIFNFPNNSSIIAKDGFLPYNSIILNASVEVNKRIGRDWDSEDLVDDLVNALSYDDNNIYLVLQHTTVGFYRIKFNLTLSDSKVASVYFEHVETK